MWKDAFSEIPRDYKNSLLNTVHKISGSILARIIT